MEKNTTSIRFAQLQCVYPMLDSLWEENGSRPLFPKNSGASQSHGWAVQRVGSIPVSEPQVAIYGIRLVARERNRYLLDNSPVLT